MIPPPVCVLYTQDPELSRRVKAYLRTTAQVRHVAAADRLDPVLQQVGSALVIMDLRAKECGELIEQIQNEYSNSLIIALGTLRSEPLREAEQLGIYAVEDLLLDRKRFQALIGRAFDYLKALQENRDLRETSTITPAMSPAQRIQITNESSRTHSLPLLRFPRALRRFENVDALLESIVQAVADALVQAAWEFFRESARGIATGSAPACAVSPKRMRWNSANATRSCDGLNNMRN